MRIQFFTALLIVVLLAGTYWYSATANVCPVPLHYRLGNLDSEFNLSPEQAIAYMQEAETVWEQEAKRDLFIYDEDASFTVDFVFDERQEFADNEQSDTSRLDAERAQNNQFFETINELQEQYENLKTEYENKVASYEERLRSYNQTVNQYNDRGGAPASEFEALQREQEELNQEAEGLTRTASELNELANRINELGERGNEMVNEYNRHVSEYNKRYGYEREFTQGDYQGANINIYKFSSESELVAVLTHEFGHALGIGHVEDDTAVMYYLLTHTGETPLLTVDDKEALFETCGTGDEISHVLRRSIRTLIGLFN